MDDVEELTSIDRFYATFDSNTRELMEPVRETLIESIMSCTKEEIIGQLLMNFLTADTSCDGKFNLRQKQSLMAVAEHMGPDWAQALYHAAVFITKVA